MLLADDAEMLRRDRLAVPLHRCQQLGNSLAVDLSKPKKLRSDWCEQPISARILR